MSTHAASGDTRQSLLTRLQEEVKKQGCTAFLALGGSAHPVLYVRTSTRLVPVVVVRDVSGNQWFIWGRTGSAHVSRVTGAAAELCENGRVTSADVSRSRMNLVAARRAMLRGAA